MPKTIIVSIHGIMTFKNDSHDWEAKYGNWLSKNRPDVIYFPFSYGWLGPVRAWLSTIADFFHLPDFSFTNNMATKRFTNFLLKVQNTYSDANIHIVSHSYGTWVTWKALLSNPFLLIQSVSFVAGVISAHVEKNQLDNLLKIWRIKSVFVWCSHDDEVVRPLAIPPFGHMGYWGLIRYDHPEDRVAPPFKPYDEYLMFNRFTSFEHDGYFIEDTFKQIQKDVDNSNGL